MGYLAPYKEELRGIRVTKPVYHSGRNYESRYLIPNIAGQVGEQSFLEKHSKWVLWGGLGLVVAAGITGHLISRKQIT